MISTADTFLILWCVPFQIFFSEYLRINKLVILQLHVHTVLCPNKQFPFIKNIFLYVFNTVIYVNILSSLVPSELLETSMGRNNWRVERLQTGGINFSMMTSWKYYSGFPYFFVPNLWHLTKSRCFPFTPLCVPLLSWGLYWFPNCVDERRLFNQVGSSSQCLTRSKMTLRL